MTDEATLRAAYATLEVDTAASPEEIRGAYLLLLKVWHPDRHQHDAKVQVRAEAKAKALNAAFELIRLAPLHHEPTAPPREAPKPKEAGPSPPPPRPKQEAPPVGPASGAPQSAACSEQEPRRPSPKPRPGADPIQPPGSLKVGNLTVEITDTVVRLGRRELALSTIRGIRWHPPLHVWIAGERSELKIVCINEFIPRGDLDERFRRLIRFLWNPVVGGIVRRMLATIRDNGVITIHGRASRGDLSWGLLAPPPALRLDSTGIHVVAPVAATLAWETVECKQHGTRVSIKGAALPSVGGLYRYERGENWLWFDVDTTWNAVCLPPLVESMRNANTGPLPLT